MTRKEHLLTIAAEECNETAQRISKALRFSLEEKQPGQSMTNAERITYEFSQLYAMMEMLHAEGCIQDMTYEGDIEDKKLQVEKYLLHSEFMGTLTE
jgi:hypothetical protein